jgi:Secretion system C-terminal sorting domain
MNAVGIVSADLQEYNTRFNNTTKDLYFIRIKSINEDSAKTTFYTDRFVVRKDNISKNGTLNVAFPSPFTNLLTVTFTDFIKEKVLFELFAVNGQKVYEETRDLNEFYADIKLPRLAKGIYLLSVKIGSNKPETVKVYGGF